MPSAARIVIGMLLLLGGILGALPILGFWMIPLGLLVLSLDFRWARRGYLTVVLWFRQRRQRRPSASTKTARQSDSESAD